MERPSHRRGLGLSSVVPQIGTPAYVFREAGRFTRRMEPTELTEEGTSRYVTLSTQGKVHYNEAGAGHPVILVHGSGAGATGWSNFRPNIGPLAEDFHVFALDCVGWGKSDAATADQYDHVQMVVEFMDELGIEKAALVGNSMGGMIALAVAARHPEKVSHLITMGPGAFTPIPTLFGFGDGPSEGLKVLIEGYANPTPQVMKKLVDVMTFGPEFATDELAELRSAAALARPDHLANALESFRGGGPVRNQVTVEEVQGITAPALLVHGRDDRVVHYEYTLRLVSTLRNSRAVLLNQCGHWAQIEHASEFNRLVRDFVVNN
jgi:2-hydroxy-6-oxonona-2,4-dienedioate hydrolase